MSRSDQIIGTVLISVMLLTIATIQLQQVQAQSQTTPPPQPQTGNTTNSTADTFYRNLADCSVLGDPVLEVQCNRVKADQLAEALEEPGIFSFQQEDNKEENNEDKEDEEN